MADAESEPMQAGVVNVLLTIDPAASHAAGTYLTWDGEPFDEEETARCDAATPHELWAWTITTDEAPGAAAEPRADVRRLTTIVATPFPIRLVIARHSLMKRSMPTRMANDSMGTDGTTESVAASVMKPAPVTPVAPFDESIATDRRTSCWPRSRCVLVACARKIAAIVI